MNLTWHIVKKDLIRLRPLLGAWAILLVGQDIVAFQLLSLRSSDLNWFNNVGMLLNVVELVGLVLGYILVAVLILDDPLVGTDVFWVTRPISGARLLGAKLIGVALFFGLLPIVVGIPWWLYGDFNFPELMLAAGRLLCFQAIAVVPAFVLATLVDQAGRFVLLSVVGAVALWVVALNFFTASGYPRLSPDLARSRWLVAAATFAVFGAVVVGRQFLTRRLKASVAAMAAGVLLATLAVFCWPWNVTHLRAADRPVSGGELITGEIQAAYIVPPVNGDPTGNEGIAIDLLFKGTPADADLAGGLATVGLRWPDGYQFTRDEVKLTVRRRAERALPKVLGLPPQVAGDDWPGTPHWDAETRAKLAALRDEWRSRMKNAGRIRQEPADQPGDVVLTATFPASGEVVERLKSAAPACSISAHLAFRRPHVVLEMPLRADSWKTATGARLHILAATPQLWSFKSTEPSKAYLTTLVALTAPGLDGLSIYVVDRRHGSMTFAGRSSGFSPVVPISANIDALYFDVRATMVWRTDKWVEVPGGLDSVTLAAVAYRDAGGRTCELRTDKLGLREDEGQ